MRNEEGVFIGYCFHGEVWAPPYFPVWHLLSNTFAYRTSRSKWRTSA